MVYWITGRKGAGKTPTAYKLATELLQHGGRVVLFDGDDVRRHFPAGFTDRERRQHIMRIARFSALLEQQGFTVIVALVSPRKAWRQEARALFEESELIYVPGGTLWPGTTYEEPDEEELR
jgi:adenylylsulfate kinase